MADPARVAPEVVRGPQNPAVQTPSPHPTRRLGIDVARGLALVFLILVECGFGLSAPLPGQVAELPAWQASLQGRAAAAFVILAGLGMSLLSATAREHRRPADLVFVKQRLRRRGWSLFLFGLALMAVWPRDALHFLGVFYLFGILTFHVPDRRLLVLTIASAALFPSIALAFGHKEGWRADFLSYKDHWSLVGGLRHLFYNGPYAVLPWMAFAFFGMWLGRRPLKEKRSALWMIFGGALVAALAELLSRQIAMLCREAAMPLTAELFGTDPIPPGPFFVLSAGGSALFALGLGLWATAEIPRNPLIRRLAGLGRTSLSTYVILAVLLTAARALHPAAFSPVVSVAAGLSFALLVLVAMPLLHDRLGRLPLERWLRAWEGRDDADDPLCPRV